MKKELADKFNDEVEQYRKALIFSARMYDWDTFKLKAGKLFDYVEQIELSELERRFLTIFRIILFVIVAVIVVASKLHVQANPGLEGIRHTIILLAIAGACFELYFFLDFRMYVEKKTMYQKKRRENFIREIQRDFKNFTIGPTRSS